MNKSDSYCYCQAIGQDSHRFLTPGEQKNQPDRRLVLGGVFIPDACALAGNSDADVLLHALTNAVSGLTGVNILGKKADYMCTEQGITDSACYLEEAMKHLNQWELLHLSFSVEAKKPRLSSWIEPIKNNIARLTGLTAAQVGLTATSGEGLTAFGKGEGIMAFCIISARKPETAIR